MSLAIHGCGILSKVTCWCAILWPYASLFIAPQCCLWHYYCTPRGKPLPAELAADAKQPSIQVALTPSPASLIIIHSHYGNLWAKYLVGLYSLVYSTGINWLQSQMEHFFTHQNPKPLEKALDLDSSYIT